MIQLSLRRAAPPRGWSFDIAEGETTSTQMTQEMNRRPQYSRFVKLFFREDGRLARWSATWLHEVRHTNPYFFKEHLRGPCSLEVSGTLTGCFFGIGIARAVLRVFT